MKLLSLTVAYYNEVPVFTATVETCERTATVDIQLHENQWYEPCYSVANTDMLAVISEVLQYEQELANVETHSNLGDAYSISLN